MPILTDDEIKRAITTGQVVGVTLDANVFSRRSDDLSAKVLLSLDQLQQKGVAFWLSEVVRGELKSHVKDSADATRAQLVLAINKYRRRWKGVDLVDPPEASGDELAEAQVMDFLTNTHAIVIDLNREKLAGEVFKRYFDNAPPFGHKADKKHEFPDAFALLSIDAKAEEEGRKVICVGHDLGWKAYCDASDKLVYTENLDLVLSSFHEAEQGAANDVVARLRARNAHNLANELNEAIQLALDGTSFYADADCPVNWEEEHVQPSIQDLRAETFSEPLVVTADADSITFTTSVVATVEFESEFHFGVHDKEAPVSFGSRSFTTEQEIKAELTITVERDLEPEPNTLESEASVKSTTIDFGYLDPFEDEDPNHPYY